MNEIEKRRNLTWDEPRRSWALFAVLAAVSCGGDSFDQGATTLPMEGRRGPSFGVTVVGQTPGLASTRLTFVNPSIAVSLPPSAPDPCHGCNADEICMQGFDGMCTDFGARCVKVSAPCKQEAQALSSGSGCYKISAACQAEYCWAPLQCLNQSPCGSEAPGVDVYCYGP